MTDPTYTALLLIIDRSGSMQAIRDDMVGGLESLLAQQAALPGRVHWRLRPAWGGALAQLAADCCTPQPLQLHAALG